MALRTPLPPSLGDLGNRPSGRRTRPHWDRRRWPLAVSWGPGDAAERRPPRLLVVALVVAGLSLMTLDQVGGDDSPVDPVRSVVGEVVGPLEVAAGTVVRPLAAIPDFFTTRGSLRDDVAALEAENAALRDELATSDLDRSRLEQYDGLVAAARDQQGSIVPARVVAHGAAQTFTRTVTIDAGLTSGVRPDMTVVAAEGLVGRVIAATSTTATVLLIVDSDSTVGARVGRSSEVGFLSGNGSLTDPTRLDLELVDASAVPAEGDVVLTWGSAEGQGPYRAGVPIGTVTQLFSTPRDTTQRAIIDPFVDLSRLDVVGVYVPEGTASDRAVIGPDGEVR
ncbi:rod shape-determining protein MreC [Nocardioides sp. ChNu-153]|uniref:rod shape-determining protein MreC n=1 Tax=unclassified Nocardioides TaxID=2615069 RepID=UPI002404DF78|nr:MULTISPECIES: rod shape-determining protein MreC [unclassified Nocardioides]MDF9716295.1 rod shape-determining protein MreC [Nocardioides sp. ChNu-99]MDN7122743.1 rod shape-determining protein MreC [Nocardioides sp. ChNu-153]